MIRKHIQVLTAKNRSVSTTVSFLKHYRKHSVSTTVSTFLARNRYGFCDFWRLLTYS